MINNYFKVTSNRRSLYVFFNDRDDNSLIDACVR
jgi:hypothetical protein